ncbi:MAG: type VI secretion system baseplate subunit TssG [Planctomycetota bacterium]
MRDSKANLKKRVLDEPHRFEFFEAARLLRIIAASEQADEQGGKQVSVRFRSSATKNFPSGQVQGLRRESNTLELTTHVMGLFGPVGVLPHHDKDLVSGGEPNMLLRDFLDLFNTRLLNLFFDAWQANRQDIQYEMYQRGVSEREDASTKMLLALCGRGLPQTRNQHRFPDDVFAGSAGLLSRNVRSSSAIRRCVASQFGVDVKISEFVEERLYLPRTIQTKLTGDELGHNQLGRTAIAGESVKAHRKRFEVRLGPLTRDQFDSLCPYDDDEPSAAVPKNAAFLRLTDLIKSILDRPLDFDIRFVVEPDAVLPARLGDSRLGFDSWVITQPANRARSEPMRRFGWDQ